MVGEFIRYRIACAEGVVDDGIKIDKPAFEEGLRHRFQRGIRLPVQRNPVIQRTQDVRDGFLLGEGRQGDLKFRYVRTPQAIKYGTGI